MAGHAELLAQLLPPSSYARDGLVGAELAIEGAALDAVLADALSPLRGLSPLAALEWLPDYERVYSLPGECRQAGLLLQERLALLTIALMERAAINRDYYIWLASQLGYAITIEEYGGFVAGFSCAGDKLSNPETLFTAGSLAGEPLRQGAPWQYVWTVHAGEEPTVLFRAGLSGAGEPLASWGNDLLECAIRQAAPAHTTVYFAYGDEGGTICTG